MVETLVRAELAVVDVAVLFADPKGVYANLPGVDLWDEARDARLYAGPWPVVAHPPCARWSRLASFVEHRWGYKRGEDGGCFASALDSVRRYGGVLEHPAYSDAWSRFGLPRPNWKGGWTTSLLDDGASCYVEQGRYGLPVKKATYLYAYGVELPDLRWGYTSDSAGDVSDDERPVGLDRWRDRIALGARDRRAGEAAWRSSGHRGANYGLTSTTTPPAFRDVLLTMARSAPAAVPVSDTRPDNQDFGGKQSLPSGGES